MQIISTSSLAMFQMGDASAHDIHLLTIFAGIIAGALVVAALGMVLASVFAVRLLHTVNAISCQVKEKVGPVLDKTHALVTDISPKIQTVTANAEHISNTVRTKLDEIAVTVTQVNQTVQHTNIRTRTHIDHADYIVKDALTAAEEISRTVQDGIKAPLRQAVGVVAGLRAGLDKLVQMSPFGR